MKVLIVDDEAVLHDAYRRSFEASAGAVADHSLEAMANSLFSNDSSAGNENSAQAAPEQELQCVFASQGLQGVAQVEQSLAENTPFQVAFIDIRMPPGIDGKETAKRIRAIDPSINLVIVSAYSDHGITEIAKVAGPPDKIFYISKPFAADEVRQMAVALSRRWDVDKLLEQKMAELAASEARAIHIAGHDFLTGAPNRRAFLFELAERLKKTPQNVGLILLDLDRFKHVNDTFGHAAGDELIASAYMRLRRIVPAEAMVARLGGDEFGIILHASDAEKATAISKLTVDACSTLSTIHGCSVNISASAGFLVSRDHHARDAAELIRFADIALYASKREGRNRASMFNAEMDESARFRRIVETGLRSAIAKNELSLKYQPIVDRESLAIVGFEALARWNSAEHGEIPPKVFIPIAEEGNLIHDIGDWIMRTAIAESRNWPNQYVSINLSARQLSRPDLCDKLVKLAAQFEVPNDAIQLEVTETALFDNVELAASVLKKLRMLGFRIALDDFGTGYSTMFNVKNFAVDCIKIDKSFIDSLGADLHSSAIVGSITQLARTLGLSVVAEGVETEIQCQALRVSSCSHLQGYLFGKPVPAEETFLLSNQEQSDDRRARG